MALAKTCKQAIASCIVTLAASSSLLACSGGSDASVGGDGTTGYTKDSGSDSADAADVSVKDSSMDADVSTGKDSEADTTTADTGPDAPNPENQCGKCDTDTDCGAGFRCVASPFGDKFCAMLCTDSCASSDYDCVDLSQYPLGTTADGGTDGGSTDGATDAGSTDAAVVDAQNDSQTDAQPTDGADDVNDSGADESSTDAGVDAKPVVAKACVPTGGESCACNTTRNGVKRTCYKSNSYGKCSGSETCTNGSWVGCNATTATKELCDGKDNNCDGFVDADEPGITGNDLCAAGSAPPHSGFSCTAGSCALSGCEKGWTRYPANIAITDGCACKVDTGDIAPKENSICDNATDLGQLPDVGSTPLSITGSLSSDTDSDWYAVFAQDILQETKTNSFRIHVEFLVPDGNPNNEFLFDVVRGSPATPCTPLTTTKSAITEWDWCADSTTNADKPADADQSAPIRIHVFRNPAAASKTCNLYVLRITNGGSGPCPAADACGAN